MFVHCGVLTVGVRKKLGLPSPFDMRFSNPLDLHAIALRHPKTAFIVPHFGAGFLREALMLADLCSNVYLDTSSSNSWMRYEALDLRTVFRRALEVVGPQRLLFGTDSSFFPRGWHAAVFAAQTEALYELGLPPLTRGRSLLTICNGYFPEIFSITLALVTVRIPFLRRIRHPFYPALTPAAASAASSHTPAIYGDYQELSYAGGKGVRAERAVFALKGAAEPFLTGRERDALWELFQVPVYALLVDRRGTVVGCECEAQDGLHLKDGYVDGVLFGRVESKPCECGRPGPRLMPVAREDWEKRPMIRRAAG